MHVVSARGCYRAGTRYSHEIEHMCKSTTSERHSRPRLILCIRELDTHYVPSMLQRSVELFNEDAEYRKTASQQLSVAM